MHDTWVDAEVDKEMLTPFFTKGDRRLNLRVVEAHEGISGHHEAHYGIQRQALYETKKINVSIKFAH